MFPQKASLISGVDSQTYPLGEHSEHFQGRRTMALVALSHTPVEHRLYRTQYLHQVWSEKTSGVDIAIAHVKWISEVNFGIRIANFEFIVLRNLDGGFNG